MLQAGESYVRKGFIFTRSPRSGEFIYHEPVRKAFNEALEAADPPEKVRVYDLRHTHISQLIIDGVDLKKASVRAGHSTIKLTADTYAHLSDEAEEEMADATRRPGATLWERPSGEKPTAAPILQRLGKPQ